jgi:hypothetical protein
MGLTRDEQIIAVRKTRPHPCPLPLGGLHRSHQGNNRQIV